MSDTRVDSDEVVQLYLTHEGVPGAALRELSGFQRVHLAHGQSRRVDFTLRDRDLSVVDSDGKRRIVNGTVKAWIGGGQPAATGQATPSVSTQFKIASEAHFRTGNFLSKRRQICDRISTLSLRSKL